MKIRVLVVGMNPADKPTLGQKQNVTFRRLEQWMTLLGVIPFSFINTVPARGAAKIANVDWELVSQACEGYDKIIALGGFPSTVLNRLEIDHFKLPHPSPRNRLLNDRGYEREQLRLCKRYLND